MTATKFGRSVATTEDYGALSDAIFEEIGIRLDIPSIKHLYTQCHITTPYYPVGIGKVCGIYLVERLLHRPRHPACGG